MKTLKQVIRTIILSIALIYIPNVYADEPVPKVKINAEEKEIYETGGEGSVTFDKTTNTLTLDNYNGKEISFENFLEDSTINIIIKGTNLIDGGEENKEGNGIKIDSKATLNITGTEGSQLTIQNYYNATYLYDGVFNVNNANIILKNGEYCGIYNYSGEVNIYNSKITTDNVKYPIATDGSNLYADNLTLTATSSPSTVLYASGKIGVDNSNINIIDSGTGMYSADLTTINNTTLDIKEVSYGIYTDNGVNIKNSKLNSSDSGNLIYNEYEATEDVTIENSDITLSESEYFIENESESKILLKNSNIKLNEIYFGIDSYGDVNIEGGTFEAINTLEDDLAPVIISPNLTIASDITINYKNAPMVFYIDEKLTINSGNINILNELNMGIILKDLEVNGGTTNIECAVFGLYASTLESKYTFNNGDFKIKTTEGVALYTYSDEEKNPEDLIILNNMIVKEENLKLIKTKLGDQYLYSYSSDEPLPQYNDIESVALLAAKEVTIISNSVVKFDANGGSGTMNNLYIAGEITLPGNEFTAPAGKKFKGWSLTTDGEIIEKLNVDSIKTVYAIWETIETNPNTSDNIISYIGIFTIALLGTIITGKKIISKKEI